MNRPASRWLRAGLALALAVMLSVWWAVTSSERTNRVPDGELPAGQVWTAPDGFRARVVSWDTPATLPAFDGSATPATEGTTWVVVTLSVRAGDSLLCLPRLFGEGTESWTTVPLQPETDHPYYCDPGADEMLVDAVYEVPNHKLAGVRGVSYEPAKQRQPALLLLPDR